MCKLPTQCRIQIWCIVAAVFAALSGTLSDQHAAYAQGTDNDYVDVGLTLEVPQNIDLIPRIIVVNNGSRTAYDVEAVVSIESPASSYFSDSIAGPLSIGSVSLESGERPRSLRLSIPALEGGKRAEHQVYVTYSTGTAPIFDNNRVSHEFLGRVTTSSFESDHHKGDNTSRVWSYVYNNAGAWWQAAGNYSVVVSVDNPSPSPGDTVNFTVNTDRAKRDKNRAATPPIDLEVAIELTGGLSVSGTPTYASGSDGTATTPSSVSYSNGVFTVGTLLGPDSDTLDRDPIMNSVTLPVTVASSAVVNEQCLTATLTGNPPPGTGPLDDHISDNVAKVCLVKSSSDQKVFFRSGQANLLALYPCVGVTTHPCNSSDSVVLAIDGGEAAINAGHASGPYQPENVVVQIRDPAGRSGSNWRTGNDTDYTDTGAGILPGVAGKLAIPIGTDGYTAHTFAISDSAYGSNPGEIKLILAQNNFVVLNTDDKLSFGPQNLTTAAWDIQFEFDKLGTYQADITLGATKSSTAYTSQKTYTFHVGPVVDIAVEKGGASSHVPADRSALSIVAVNNGPDELPGGARVTGLPKGAQVFHASHGSYNGSTGVWDIGELRARGYYRSSGVSEPTLVLGASAGDTASVKIAGTKKYEVCIASDGDDLAHTTQATCEAVTGASWHTTAVYDDNAGNNSATIRAARGTGGRTVQPTPSRPVGGPVAPANLTAQTGTTTVKWDAVGLLYGLPVVRYEVQELQGSDWRLLDRVTTHNEYAVMQPRGRSYRVRAVNAAGAVGPWSQSTAEVAAGLPGSPLNLRAQADGNNAIDVSWDAPDDIGGSAITGYTVQWSPNAPGSWRGGGSTSASVRTWKHGGLSVGAVNYYRVAARNSGGLGLWSDPVMGQTVSGAPDAPTLQAKTLSDYEIELTWNKPRDNGQPVTGYHLESSADGASGSWTRLAAPGAGDTTYTDATLQANTKRYYRIRAMNSVGEGAWSRTVSTTTQLTPPWAPSNHQRGGGRT